MQETNFGWFYVDKERASEYLTKLVSDKTSQKVCPGAEPYIDEDTGQVLGLRFHRSHWPVLGIEAPDEGMPKAAQRGSGMRTYQAEAVQFIEQREGAILADDLGLGKSFSAIWASRPPLLVACPLSVVDVWVGEVAKWRPDWNTLVVRNKKDFDGQFKGELWTHYQVIVLPYSQTGIAGYFSQAGVVGPPHTLICDEGHMLTNKGVTWGQNLRLVQPQKRRIVLTATPMRNGLASLWGLLDFVSPRAWGGKNEFLRRYMGATTHPFAPRAVQPQEPTHQDELAARLREVIIKRSRDDVDLKMPGHLRFVEHVPVDLSGIRQRVRELGSRLHAGKGAQTLQVMAELRHELGRQKLRGLFDTPRLSATLRERRSVLWFWHKDLAREAVQRLKRAGFQVDSITGEASSKKRKAILEEWADPVRQEPRVLVATMAAACSGISLKNCHQAVFVELDWSPVIVMQAEKRHHRPGNVHERVDTVYVEATHNEKPISIDAAMLQALHAKVVASSGALGADSQRDQIQAMLFGNGDGVKKVDPDTVMVEFVKQCGEGE